MIPTVKIEKNNLKSSYKYYKTNNPENPVDKIIYLKIAAGYMLFLIDKLVEGWQVQLSGGNSLGTLAIVFKKIILKDGIVVGKAGKASIDWGRTMKLHRENPDAKGHIYHTNEHTNGYRAAVVWWKTGMNIQNKYLYSFVTARGLRQKVALAVYAGAEYLTNQKL